VRLVCEGKIINAHKVVLSRCPYLDAMLRMASSSFFGFSNVCITPSHVILH
jgi:hypothetical protein